MVSLSRPYTVEDNTPHRGDPSTLWQVCYYSSERFLVRSNGIQQARKFWIVVAKRVFWGGSPPCFSRII